MQRTAYTVPLLGVYHHETIRGAHQPAATSAAAEPLVRNMSSVNDPSTRILESKIISNTYSGFVHGLSARTMEMYFGEPERFHV
jgi:hypothetical protein